jgi:hypothetical protein
LIVGRPIDAAAPRAVSNLQNLDHHVIAELYLDGMLGRLIAEQADGRRAGADPNTSLLRPMLERAAATFSQAIADDPSTGGHAQLEEHLSLCLLALGHDRQAAAALSRSDAQRTHVDAAAQVSDRRAAA